MRQRDDLEFAQVLNTLRTRLKSRMIEDEDIQLLTSRCVTDGNAPNDVLHIYALNKDVKKFNDKMLHMTCDNIITIQALDVPITGNQKGAPRKTPVRDAKTMLADSVKLAANARVMLTTNLDVSDGLSNNILGTVAEIVKGQMPHHQPQYIYIRFNNSSIRINIQTQNPLEIDPDVVIIKPYTEQFRHEGANHTRLKYPLKLSWACSIHRTQMMTLKSAAVSLKNIFQPGMAYVTLSRVTSLAVLHLLDFDTEMIYSNPEITQALDIMQCVNIQSMSLLKYIEDVQMTVVAHNIHSIQSHLDDVKNHPELMSADILAFCETWLSSHITDSAIALDGFCPAIRCDRSSGSSSGGIAVYVKDGIRAAKIPSPQHDGIENVVLEVEDITVIALYRSPSTKLDVLSNHLNEILATTTAENKIMILGDFNINVIDQTEKMQVPSLTAYQQIIKDATYHGGGAHRSLLDHIYIRNCGVHDCGVLNTYFSDHNPIFVRVK